MFINPRGELYDGDMCAGDREATALEIAAWMTPTKERLISEVLATLGRGKDRTLIQQVVSFAELVVAPALAAQYGVSLELAVMGLYARNKTYRYCKDCETACQAIEEESP
jgi:hypothetical protein